MENNFKDLPPLKRFRLIQQQQELELKSLPAKKRKHFTVSSSPPPSYSLPAKKRVSAFRPFDLNLDYPFPEDDELGQIKNPLEKNQENLDDPFSEDDILGQIKTPLEKNQENLDNPFSEDDELGQIKKPLVKNQENQEPSDNVSDDDGIVCAVCQSTDADPSDPIVFCDGCDLMVHTTCYGTPLTNGVPEGDWFCSKCLVSKKDNTKVISCCLCPETEGAMKRAGDENWAHIVCALFVPEVFFQDSEGREGIDTTEVPSRRWGNKCYLCDLVKGCVIDCSEPKCPLAFHVTCGLKQELCIEYREGKSKGAIVAGFCKTHTNLWTKQQQSGKFKIVARDEHKRN
ncbi:hypothetical protein DCAR_0522442 [Daucus carota subsp. sativus]|uniref:PHD-type domain-containing protein n=1 Tax=Daucus carota subsp. sativus TaxID=79200 RepID=A0A164ZTI8_DAUCS|nr:PREDICTED: nuA3 HAT complex component NTO1 [Daucus carota subsp. sativus]WOH03051.1 hypothetical protein DCAR_0522442 [Daucus carota subsp. sativus]